MVALTRVNYPQFPAMSASEYRAQQQSFTKFGRTVRGHVAVCHRDIVGHAFLLDVRTSEGGQFWTEVQVRKDHRRRGLGARLLEKILENARGLGAVQLLSEYLDTADPCGREFSAAHNFHPNGGHGEQLSRLDVAKANLKGFTEAEEVIKQQGIRIETIADLRPDDEFMHALYRLDMDTHRDVPSPVEWVNVPFGEWLEVFVSGPGRSLQWAWAALEDDRPVALARLQLSGRDAAENAYTGVLRSHRGRGLARALKNRTILWCRENGIPYIFTGNSVRNHRMLAINRSLGYEPLPATIEVVRDEI